LQILKIAIFVPTIIFFSNDTKHATLTEFSEYFSVFRANRR